MDIVGLRDPKSYFSAVAAAAVVNAVAGGAGNAAAVTGITIDLVALGVPQSLVFLLQSSATLSAAATLSLTDITFQTSGDGVTWEPYESSYGDPADPGVVGTGATGGSTVETVTGLEVYVASAQQYFRILFTPTLSASEKDTATIMAAVIAAGFARYPAA
ncbi:hypothetical protein [Gluconobacter morbifer]|uniref:Uncharacterized protein n=1 Tax=Gluconobacter morbifer G707 TaxID=1088869 RepID=G6XIV6_9PROT|nr:hypothetical protein [Gluconobacter morbifer]EHH68386.1 hypothetical protein GMO_11560 [Gluconobacter morbifer G707]